MLYEPIGYLWEYEVGALAIYLVILLRYFSARRFPNQRSKLYGLILWATVANVILDVSSSVLIDNVPCCPVALVFAINSAFYASEILMLVLMMYYALALSGHIDGKVLLRTIPLLLPGMMILLLLIVNPFTHQFFYVEPKLGYVHASNFVLIYVVCFIYLAITFVITLRGRTRMRREEFSTILGFLAIVLVATLVQYLIPALLVTGVAIMLSVTLMYFTIQNPDTMTDASTGAFTSEAMLMFLRDRLQERDRVQIVAVKVRNMPRINELLGIENGSLLLRQVSEFLQDGVMDSWVFRMRGSCFVAITRSKADYALLHAQLDQRIGSPWIVQETEVLLQATVCCVDTTDLLSEPISPEETVNYLETAFAQKGHTINRISYVVAGMEILDTIKRIGAVEAALREALSSGRGLELVYQPLWSVKQERFVSAEVLLRFHHPVMGSISPSEFVPIAENCGLIMALDEFVVRRACAFLRTQNNLRGTSLSTLEINLSALEFMHRKLPELLSDIMAQFQVDPSLLCFEVTETAATESFALLRECMVSIRQYGCRFALDDFGTGYANISQVIQLPFSIVKLDKSLLGGPPVVLNDLVRMFTRMNRETVVEGVENALQAELVASYGVDVIQGFYYAKPMTESEFVQLLRNQCDSVL